MKAIVVIACMALLAVPSYPVTVNVVSDYHADNSGSTDCTVQVQRAFDSIPAAGGTVYFPSGTYMLSGSINVSKSNVEICGYTGAPFSILLKNRHLSDYKTFYFCGGSAHALSGIQIHHLSFVAQGIPKNDFEAGVLDFDCGVDNISNISIRDNRFDYGSCTGKMIDVWFAVTPGYSIQGLQICDNRMTSGYVCISILNQKAYLHPGTDLLRYVRAVDIKRNFLQASDCAITMDGSMHDIDIASNHIKNSNIGVELVNLSGCTLDFNLFEGVFNTDGGIIQTSSYVPAMRTSSITISNNQTIGLVTGGLKFQDSSDVRIVGNHFNIKGNIVFNGSDALVVSNWLSSAITNYGSSVQLADNIVTRASLPNP